MGTTSSHTATAANPACFLTTHWSVVLAAGHPSPRSQAALEKLCRTYWYPLYTYVRRRGYSPEDAQDLTQEFFFRLLRHNWVAAADQARGRFRSFLLMALNRFLTNEWHKGSARKRGGGVRMIPLEFQTAETRFVREPVDTRTPEQCYEQQWVFTLLDEVLVRLRAEYAAQDQAALFDSLRPSLIGSRETQPYAQLATALGLTEGAVKVAVHRLRGRYRERLREEIAQTVATPEEVEAELRHLFRVLARG